MAVAARTSFAVAVPQAGDRFVGGSGVLAVFVVLQLAVYAAAQLPVGLALDRFGPRQVLVAGALLVALGQGLLALAGSLPGAIGARVLVGIGDATAFIGALRLVPAWFPLGRVPMMSQVVSVFGQCGQVVSAVPFVAVLGAGGWERAFAVMSGLGLASALIALAVIRDLPPGAAVGPRSGREPVGATLARVVRQPGTWLGFFTHWMGMFPTAVLVLMWGMSWMTQGLGLPTATASALLTANTAAGVVGSFVAGALSARLPACRAATITMTSLVALGAWCAGLALPGALPAAATATILLGFTAPFSGVGFDSARSFNEPARWGTCTGVVNMGGFTATILSVELVGLVLDAVGGDRSAADFRLAFAATLAVWLAGMTGLALAGAAVRRRLRAGALTARF